MVKKVVSMIAALLVVSLGQFVIARSCFVMDGQEVAAVLGAGIPNCDCGVVSGGTDCTTGYPSSCTTDNDCKKCTDSAEDKKCNTENPGTDISGDCSGGSNHTCTGYRRGTCVSNNCNNYLVPTTRAAPVQVAIQSQPAAVDLLAKNEQSMTRDDMDVQT